MTIIIIFAITSIITPLWWHFDYKYYGIKGD